MTTIVFTGQSPEVFGRKVTRAMWTKLAEQAGYQTARSVTSKVDILVASYPAAKEGTTKWIKACEKGIRTISYEDFFSIAVS